MAASKARARKTKVSAETTATSPEAADLERLRDILVGPQADVWQSRLDTFVKDVNARFDAIEQSIEQQFTATSQRITNDLADLSNQLSDLSRSSDGAAQKLGDELDQTASKLTQSIADVASASAAAEQRLLERLKQELDQLRANKTDSERLAGLMRKLGDEILGRE